MEDGKQQEEMNDMFLWDCGSLSLWGAGDGSGGAIEVVGDEEAEKGDGSRTMREELGKAVIGGEGVGGDSVGGKGEDEAAAGAEEVEFHIKTERERRKKMRSTFDALHALIPHLPLKTDKATIVEATVNYIGTLEQRLRILQHKKLEKLNEAKSGFNFNTFTPSPSSINPNLQPQPHEIISRELALVADDHYLHSSSSSRSITPPNSNPTTPKVHITSGSGSGSGSGSSIMMINTPPNPNPSSPIETAVKLTLSPSSVMFRTFTSKNVVLCVCGQEAHFNICGARRPGFYTGISSVLDKYRLEVKSCQVSSDDQSNRTTVAIQARATALLDQYPAEDIYKAAAVEMVPFVSP